MANPQPDKFVKISTELLDALCRIRVPGEARQVFDVIIRKTYGFKKKGDFIALSQLAEATGLKKQHAHRAQRKLEKMNMISVTKKGYNAPSFISINKDYETWISAPKSVTKRAYTKTTADVTKKGYNSKLTAVTNKAYTVPEKGDINVPNMGTTIDIKINNNKERCEVLQNQLKKTAPAALMITKFFQMTLDQEEQKKYLPKKDNWKGKYDWLNTVKLLHERDGYPYWKIFDIIHYARVEDDIPKSGDFCWKDNLFTIPALRKMSRNQGIYKIHVIYNKIKKTLDPPNVSDEEYIAKEIQSYAEENN